MKKIQALNHTKREKVEPFKKRTIQTIQKEIKMNTKMRTRMFSIILIGMLLGLTLAKPNPVQAEDEPLLPAGIVDAGSYHTCALTLSISGLLG